MGCGHLGRLSHAAHCFASTRPADAFPLVAIRVLLVERVTTLAMSLPGLRAADKSTLTPVRARALRATGAAEPMLSSLRVEADNGGLLKIHVLVAFGWGLLIPKRVTQPRTARQQVTTSRRILSARKTHS